MEYKITERLSWVDQVKGFTIFLVVYGHNFPSIEKYIYSFHMPLFIMMAGFFHPKTSTFKIVKKRFHAIMVPYFIWSIVLYLFWYFLGRHYGDSLNFNLSPLKNFLGIFYSQGDRYYMDWGIPLWYLPALFLIFLLLSFILKFKSPKSFYTLLFTMPILGFIYTRLNLPNMPWSLNIALVGLLFYYVGYCCFEKIKALSIRNSIVLIMLMALINIICFNLNIKIDMYRGIYGNEFYFILNGISGSIFILLFFKLLPIFNFLGFIGKFSLTILALQVVALTFIKFILLKIFHVSNFTFSELEKFICSIFQIIILIPSFLIINKYLPFLNGGYKKI